jgi:hypothetical protein
MHHPITAAVALALALAGISLPEAMASVSRVPVRIVYVSCGGGFDWGDVAIGAVAGAGLTLLGLGGALAVSQRHTDLGAGPRRPGADRGPLPSASQSTRQSREFR